MQDDAGHRIVFERDGNCSLRRLVSPSGFFLAFEYGNEYRAMQVTDDEGRVVRYTYEDGRLIGVDAGVRYTLYKYDGGLLSSIVGNDGSRLVDVSYRNQRVTEIALADGRRVRFAGTDGSSDESPMRVEIVDAGGVARRR